MQRNLKSWERSPSLIAPRLKSKFCTEDAAFRNEVCTRWWLTREAKSRTLLESSVWVARAVKVGSLSFPLAVIVMGTPLAAAHLRRAMF